MTLASNRITYLDNLKALLIFLVVLGHYYGTGMVYDGTEQFLFPTAVYSFIYLFHMPLFAFLSGCFSRHAEKRRARAFSELLLPYLVVNTIFIVFDGEQSNPLLAPYGPMWYPLALFLWRICLPDVGRLRHAWIWGLAFALASMVLLPGKNYVSLGQTITFFPCFLLGCEIRPETLERLRRAPKALAALGLLGAFAGVMILLGVFGVSYLDIGFFSRYYTPALSSVKYVAAEVGRYGVALVLGACLICLIPAKNGFFTRLGRNSLTVMIFHSVPHLRDLMYNLNPLPGNLIFSLVWWMGLAVIVTVLTGSNRAARWFDAAMNLLRRKLPLNAQPPSLKSPGDIT